ncbi:tol-pal system protein YbgF [Aliikangiella sp. IMCC44359]|uniref:tol-pal system protein YbgF n=1 Tax=Aliikangiella sp. IMCC44359 TaxID=3459125 RepID=UPI00403B31C2
MKGNSLLIVAAIAATFSLTSTAQSNLSLEQRITQLEKQNQTKNQLQSQMSMQLIELQNEVKELRGIVEEHQFKLQQIQERQRDLYRDIENRLSSLPRNTAPVSQTVQNSKTTVAKPTTQPATKSHNATSSGEREEFEAAFKMVRNRQYAEAVKGFEAFLAKYPQGGFSDNARFWIGQVYFAQSKLEEAEKQFSLLRTEFPQSSKLATAILKLAEIKVKQQKWEEARALYNEVVSNHSGAQQQLARKGLLDLKQSGH